MGIEHWTKTNKPLRIMRVEMVPISMVHPHEAVIGHEVEEFCNSLTNKGVFYRPILLDSNTYVVLDGHHRLAGLKHIGATKIPAILIDYQNDEIELYTWFPAVWAYQEELASFLVKNDLEVGKFPFSTGKKKVDSGESAFCTYRETEKYSMVINGDSESILDILSDKYHVEYVDTLDFSKEFPPDKGELLYRRSLTKDEVIKAALEGRTYAPKTTRHYLPFRYQDIRVKVAHLF